MQEMTPREIVHELDRYIIGQNAAKRAVSIALRNRWRRMQLDAELRNEVTPKNILMIGPTGVGKTEIARRLAALANAPFIKVEATKFTEVGYVGKDVEQIIRDLAEAAVKMAREQAKARVRSQAEDRAEDRILDALLPRRQTVGFANEPAAARRARRRNAAEAAQAIPRRPARRARDRDRGRAQYRRRDHGAAGHGGNDQPAAWHVPVAVRIAARRSASCASPRRDRC